MAFSLTLTGLCTLAAVGLGWWFKKDSSFRKREFIAVSAFWILVVATPWGATAIAKAHEALGTGAQVASDTVNNVSSR
jgi:hypothetical protein